MCNGSGGNAGLEETAADWAAANRCPDGPFQTFRSATTRCAAWNDCLDGTFVEYCWVEGLGHEWPGRPRPDRTSPVHPPPRLRRGTTGLIPAAQARPPTDLDATTYIFQRFSVRPRPGRSRAISVSHSSRSELFCTHFAFVWARRAPNRPKRWVPARAVAGTASAEPRPLARQRGAALGGLAPPLGALRRHAGELYHDDYSAMKSMKPVSGSTARMCLSGKINRLYSGAIYMKVFEVTKRPFPVMSWLF